MSKLLRLWFAVALAVSASACSADAEQGANSAELEDWRVGQPCVSGATPANPAWCRDTWACTREGQCLPTTSCSSDADCGCGGREPCAAACAGSCYRRCTQTSDCEGTAVCVRKLTSAGTWISVCD